MTPVDRRGMWVAVGAYVLWGVMPLYWHLLKAVPSLQIVLHRIAWSALVGGAYMLWRDGRGWLRRTLAGPRRFGHRHCHPLGRTHPDGPWPRDGGTTRCPAHSCIFMSFFGGWRLIHKRE